MCGQPHPPMLFSAILTKSCPCLVLNLTMRMPRVSKRFLDSPSWVRMEKFWLRTEELAVAVDRSREGLREPVKGCAIEHLVL